MEYIFVYDLEKDGEVKGKSDLFSKGLFYGVRYYKTDSGVMVEVGDNLRHEIIIEGKYWNRILRIIRDKRLDDKEIEAVVSGLMWQGLPEEFRARFIFAIRNGKIIEVKK